MTNYVPVLTSLEASCLTSQNWKNCGIKLGSLHLDSLLIKPGLSVLSKIENIMDFFGFDIPWILNISHLMPTTNHQIKLRSELSGELVHISMEDLITLMIHLKPTYLVASEAFLKYESALVSVPSLPNTSFSETNKPSSDGYDGIIYGYKENFDLKLDDFKLDMQPLVSECLCEACQLNLSRAYLHHLYFHTPLLAKRFLIQHNWSYLRSAEISVSL